MNEMQLLLKRYKRKVNKVIKGGGVLSILFALLISLVIPPFNINAQSLTSPFLGVNVQVTQVDTEYNSLTLPRINIGYLSGTVPSGYISGQLNCTNPSTPTSSQPCDIYQFQNSSGTGGASNGTRVYLNLQQYYLEANGNASFNSSYNYIIDYEFVLDDNYKGYVTFNNGNADKTYYVNGNSFHYSIRQTGLTEIQFSIVDYDLTRVTDSLMWSFPMESFPIINKFADNEIVQFLDNSYYIYPIFSVPTNYVIRSKWGDTTDRYKQTFIFAINKNVFDKSTFNSIFSSTNATIDSVVEIYRNDYGGNIYSVVKVKFHVGSSSNYTRFTLLQDVNMIPIWLEYDTNVYASSEFAERYNLYGQVQSSKNLEAQKDTFDITSNNLYSSENAFNTDMNNKLQSIDTSFNPSTSFGSKFLSSADWVRTQFNNLTSTSPFGTVLSFSMLLGLSLLIIGKVFK